MKLRDIVVQQSYVDILRLCERTIGVILRSLEKPKTKNIPNRIKWTFYKKKSRTILSATNALIPLWLQL